MNHIFDANDAVTAQCRFNKVVRGDGCPLAVNFDKSTLVNQFTNGFQVGCTPSDVGFCKKKDSCYECGIQNVILMNFHWPSRFLNFNKLYRYVKNLRKLVSGRS